MSVTFNSSEEVHVGDTPLLEFEFYDKATNLAADISTATEKTVLFQRPDGTSFTRTAEFVTDGTDGKTEYQVLTADFDVESGWIVQAFAKLSDARQWHGPRVNIRVWPVLAGS